MNAPDGWNFRPLGDFIAELEAGVSVNADDERATSADLGVLKVSAVSGGKFYPQENKKIWATEHTRADVNPSRGKIIISRSNTPLLVGENAYIQRDYPTLFLSDKLWQTVYREGTEMEPLWLSQVLQSPRVRRQMIRLATGTSGSMKNISKPALLELEVLTPPLLEQRQIARILSAWDRALERTEVLLLAKTRRKRALMQWLLTGRRRLPGFSASWVETRLGHLFTERSERGRSGLPLLSITGTRGVIPRDDLAKRDTSNADKSLYLRIAPGDIGYNTMRMWQGVSALSALEGIISPAYTVCTPGPKVDGRFAAHLFKLPRVVSRFHRYSQGLVDDTLNLKFDAFSVIHVTLPDDVAEQRAIARVLDTCDREVALLRRQRDALAVQKRGLMQRLLTGKIRVQP